MADPIDLERVDSWPGALLHVLDRHCDLFCTWEENHARPSREPREYVEDDLDRAVATARVYDEAIYEVCAALRPFAIRGWHCTRLTEAEITDVLSDGLVLPDDRMLGQRIDRATADGLLPAEIAVRLKARNQAHEPNRAGMVWFCFYPPRLAGERGIERFFRHWGGEALYNFHEDDPVTSPVLRAIGVPSLVEAEVPIALFRSPVGPALNVTRRFAISRGCQTNEPVRYEDHAVHPLPAALVRRVIRHPEPDFFALTGCDGWSQPLT